jgi:hypothetical protein
MTEFSFEAVTELFEGEGWEITDSVSGSEEQYTGAWSVTARTGGGVRVAVDEMDEELELNNVFIESELEEIDSVEEFDLATEIAEQYRSIRVQCQSAEGLFQRTKSSVDTDLTEREIIERLNEKDVSVGFRFIVTESSDSIELNDIQTFVSVIEKSLDEFFAESN